MAVQLTDADRRFINFGPCPDGTAFIDRSCSTEIAEARRAQRVADEPQVLISKGDIRYAIAPHSTPPVLIVRCVEAFDADVDGDFVRCQRLGDDQSISLFRWTELFASKADARVETETRAALDNEMVEAAAERMTESLIART